MKYKFLIFIFLNLFWACQSKKAESETSKKAESLFENEEELQATLQMDLETVLKDIKNSQYHEAVFVWKNKKIKAKVKTRGNFRRDPDHCNFPPLFVKLDSVDVLNTPFETLDKLVWVTHCQNKDENYEQMLVEEYGIYRTYALLTDKSLRAKLAKITYQDSKNIEKKIEKIAFLVENFRDMEKRLNGKMYAEKDTVKYESCNSFLMTQIAVFQFMIGNTDWSVSNKHNIEIMQIADKQPVPIPYDFDLSGIINAPYAEASPEMELKSVTERLYRGYCGSESEFFWVLEKFGNKQKSIDSLWQNLPYHQEKRRNTAKKYLDSFFKIIKNKDSVDFYFLKNCR